MILKRNGKELGTTTNGYGPTYSYRDSVTCLINGIKLNRLVVIPTLGKHSNKNSSKNSHSILKKSMTIMKLNSI